MWLNQLFGNNSIDIAKRCRTRMKVGAGFMVLGAAAIGMVFLLKGGTPALDLNPDIGEFISEYYTGLGAALMAAGAALIIKNRRYLKNPQVLKKREVAENDERNRLIGLRCWAYTGYAMFLVLYIGILISGFISITVLVVLQAVIAIYALILLAFRILLNRCM